MNNRIIPSRPVEPPNMASPTVSGLIVNDNNANISITSVALKDAVLQVTTLLNAQNDARLSILMKENEELRKRLDAVEESTHMLKRYSGVDFPQFNLLPLEIRRFVSPFLSSPSLSLTCSSYIWEFALRAPQLHILDNNRITASKINSVIESCSEAKEVANGLKLDYFIFNRIDPSHGEPHPGSTKHYVNLGLDTIWINPQDFSMYQGDIPEDVEWHCGRCKRKSTWWSSRWIVPCVDCCISKPASNMSPGPRHVRQLAINLSDWRYPGMHGTHGSTTIDLIWGMQVETVLFVIGDTKPYVNERNVQFVSPSQSPNFAFVDPSRGLARRPGSDGTDPMDKVNEFSNWRDLEDNWLRYFEDYKMERLFKRKRDLAGKCIQFLVKFQSCLMKST